MADSYLALITPLTGAQAGGTPTHPIYNPAHPDQGLPGGGTPPGIWGPTDPRPTPPIAVGTPVPPGTINPPLPEPPPEYASQIIVAVHKPGEPWVVKTYDPNLSVGYPLPPLVATPKG